MNGFHLRLAALFLLLMSAGCVSSQKLTERGDLASKEGLYKEAAQYYLKALDKELHNDEARRGLRRTGQQYMDVILSDFYEASATGDKATAVYAYRTADQLYASAARVSVRLERPNHYQSLYNDILEEYKVELYDKAVDHMHAKSFEDAKTVLNELYNLDAGYRDTENLRKMVVTEPLYMQAQQAMHYGRYREAVDVLSRLEGIDPHYKDAHEMHVAAKDKLTLTMALLPFRNLSRERHADEKMAAYLLGSINDQENEYLKVVDRLHTRLLLEEQKLGMSGLFDQATAAQAGRMLGVKTVVIGKVISYKETKGEWVTLEKEGYEEYFVESPYSAHNKERKFKDTTYTERVRIDGVRLSVQYLLLSSETGEILSSDIVDVEEILENSYVEYNGDKKALYPKKNGKVLLGGEEKTRLDEMLKRRGEKSISMERLSTGAFTKAADEIAIQIDKYEKSRQ